MSLVLVPVSSAGALTCRVPQDEPTVQAAIDNANCAVIKLGTATYTEVVQAGSRSFTLVGNGMNKTILSGGDAGRTLDINGTTNKVVIRNLTIADGLMPNASGAAALSAITEELTLKRVKIANSEVNYSGTPVEALGAGMYATGEIQMQDSIVTGNEFQGDEIGLGAGIFIGPDSKLKLTDSLVSKNVGASGGGIYSASPVVIRNSTIRENAVDHNLGGGGGILINGSKLSVFDSTIKKNTGFAPAPGGGGIRVIQTARLSLVRSLVVDNKAQDGGGIFVSEGEATIKNSTIQNNHAVPGFGGGVFVEDKTTIKNSTLSGNTAADGGGAIEDFSSDGSLTLINSTLSDNHAEQYGGGVDAYFGSSATLTNVTFTKNSAGAPGGGFHFDGDDSDYKIKNVISAGNSTASFAPDCDGAFVSLGGNVIGDPEGCSNLDHPSDVFEDPKLGALSSNGGPTLTHLLKPGSPAIGRGRPGCPGADQRGAPRKDCDSGAYERVRCEGALVAIIGTGGKNKLKGTNGPDGILGLGGKDRLVGRGADDGLCGGKGNDRLLGGGGDDSLDGEGGNDTCVGGSGNDQAKACETEKSL